MRKITIEAINAFNQSKPFFKSNTTVIVDKNCVKLVLFGNIIAYKYLISKRILKITNCGYFTNVTKERLNGLEGVFIRQKQGDWYLNGFKWDGKLITIL